MHKTKANLMHLNEICSISYFSTLEKLQLHFYVLIAFNKTVFISGLHSLVAN